LDKATREVLKSDPIAAELAQTVGYVATHRAFAIKVGAAVLAVLLIGAAYMYYRDRMAAERQGALAVALRVREGQVGTSPGPEDPRQYFGNLGEKQSALRKALLDVVTKYPSSNEASMSHYQLGVLSSDEGKAKEAEDQFKQAEAVGGTEYKAAARWALQEIYAGDGRIKEAEAILRSFIASPTDMVSKEQASIELARMIAKTNPTEARALVEPLSRTDRSAVARYAQSILVSLPGGISPAPVPKK
jgi:tetratricopeptide (TPR) repeat protein